MINGAQEIIGGVPGHHLDPLLLAKSQTRDSIGFIMIAYEQIANSEIDPVSNPNQPFRFYDLFFFKGPLIYECARLNQDLRFKLNIDTALKTFNQFRELQSTKIFLYQASEEVILRFRSTFYYEPCLKVHIESLTKKQILTLLKTSRCQKGIIECNEFTQMRPAIQLVEVYSQEQLANFNPTLKHGRLLLYDVEKNREIIRERYSLPLNNLSNTIEQYQTIAEKISDTSLVIAPSLKSSSNHIQISTSNNERCQMSDDLLDDYLATDKTEVDEFTKFIQQILNSPISEKSTQFNEVQKDVVMQEGFVIHLDKNENSNNVKIKTPNHDAAFQHNDSDKKSSKNAPEFHAINKTFRERTKSKKLKSNDTKEESSRIISDNISTTSTKIVQQPSEYVHLFERLFRSFRQQVFECFGDKCETVITRAEQKVRFLSPEFDYHNLNDDSALMMLDVIESIINDASLFKRSKLRQAAVTLISDLYNKQYNLLEQHHAIDKIEQIYYRLKK